MCLVYVPQKAVCGADGRFLITVGAYRVLRQDSVAVLGQFETCCTFLSPLAGWNSSFEDKKVLANGACDISKEAFSRNEKSSKCNRAEAEPVVDALSVLLFVCEGEDRFTRVY